MLKRDTVMKYEKEFKKWLKTLSNDKILEILLRSFDPSSVDEYLYDHFYTEVKKLKIPNNLIY